MASKHSPIPKRRTFAARFQTVDMSAGNGGYALERAKRFPNRKYAAVDLELHAKGEHASSLPKLLQHHVTIGTHNIAFMQEMQRNGWRTHNINMHLPEVGEEGLRMANTMMKLAPHVLVPNGRIFIASVDRSFLSIVGKFAQREGMRWSWRPTIQPHQKGRESDWSQGLIHDPLYRIMITCRPRAREISERKQSELRKRFQF